MLDVFWIAAVAPRGDPSQSYEMFLFLITLFLDGAFN